MNDKPGRLYFIDNLRTLLVVGVILVHLAVTYGASGHWYYRDDIQPDIVTEIVYALLGAIGSSLMGFFFMISSYFSPRSFDNKGPWRLLRERLLRLGLPLLFYVVVIDPLIVYAIRATIEDSGASLWEFLAGYWGDYQGLGVGPLWFVEALLIFTIVYVLWGVIAGVYAKGKANDAKVPGVLPILLFAFAIGLVTFLVRIWLPMWWIWQPVGLPLPSFPQYFGLYVLGIIAYRRGWVLRLSKGTGRAWFVTSMVLTFIGLPLLYVAGGALEGDTETFMGGMHWQSLAFSIWQQLVCMGLVIGLLAWFRSRFNRQGKLAAAMSAGAYTAFVIHAPVLVLIGLALRDVMIYPLMKFLLVAPLAVSLCFLLSHVLRKLPVVSKIL